MASPKTLFFAAILVVFVSWVARGRNAPRDIVRATCVHASYPNLCLRTLSAYTGPAITTPRDLAHAAVKISLSHARSAAAKLASVKASAGARRRERAALVDCVEQIGDSVEELSRTLSALKRLRQSSGGGAAAEFRWELSNAETWVSAALTNEDTCLDGFEGIDGEIKTEVKKKITKVARVTSNALYMINRLDDTRGKPHTVDP
ncbi:PREDICTED: 21 kDa protein isoform X2 [Tarenaya hassleriana]|uniref:21 kDa protein isoform X2 n=1 Tax=Tarenaya hassleriana TaxID=28532 RepID=UPI00053CA409|nr:PREDICTED: 21 kDa protein isoform X2 [Tarenaya hassleriana]